MARPARGLGIRRTPSHGNRRVRRALISALLWALLADSGSAQPALTVTGRVFDPSDAILPGAKVTLSSAGRDELRTTTDVSGTFHFHPVAPGRYEVQAEYEGFKTGRMRINLRTAADENPVRLVLAIADHQEKVRVDAERAQPSVNSQENLDTIRLNPSDLENLPLLDGDVVAALSRLLDPAVVGAAGPTVVIDGLPGSGTHIRPSEIQEVKINNNPYSAEFAQPGRGRIEIITKSGSSKYHGSVDLGLRDFRLDARNAFAVARPPERRRQLDASVSGPVLKGERYTFSLTASRVQEDRQPIIYAFGPEGPIQEDVAQTQTSNYVSGQLTRRIDKNALSFRYTLFDWANAGAGAGGFVLPETGSQSKSRYHQFYSTYQTVISPQLLNQFLVRVRTEDTRSGSALPGVPKTVVTDAFTSGGAQVDTRSTENRLELTDTFSWSHGPHFLKWGINVPVFSRLGSTDLSNHQGTFYFASLDDYVHQQPYSFVQQSGDGHLVFWQEQAAGFLQYEVKLRRNLSLAGGLRYEWQNYGSTYHNFAPRLSLAYGLGKSMKTVLRGGAGFFYDSVPAAEISKTLLLDGSRLHQIQLLNPVYPDPFPRISSFAAIPSNLVRFAPGFKSPYTFQYSVGLERQLRKSLSLTTTYTAVRGVDLYRSRNVNAPLPPSYVVPPDSSIGVLQQIESSASSKSQSLYTALRGSLSRYFNGMVMYELGHAMSDTDGIVSFPANNWNLQGEWSRASFDIRHYVYVYGTLNAGKLFKFGVIFSANSGKPYTMTTGVDTYHDGMTNARPPGIARYTLQGTGSATLDLRWSREFHMRSSDKSEWRLVTRADAFNLLNRVNYISFVGNLSSPFFRSPVAAAPPRWLQLSISMRF